MGICWGRRSPAGVVEFLIASRLILLFGLAMLVTICFIIGIGFQILGSVCFAVAVMLSCLALVMIPTPAVDYTPLVNLINVEAFLAFTTQGNEMAGFLAEVGKFPTFVVFLGDMFDGANVLAMVAGSVVLEVLEEADLGVNYFLIASILLFIGSTIFYLQEWYIKATEELYFDVPARIPAYLHPYKNILKKFTRGLHVGFSFLRIFCCIALLLQMSSVDVILLSSCIAIFEFWLGILDRHCLSSAICVPCPKRGSNFVVPAIRRRRDGIYVSGGCPDCISSNCSGNNVPQVPGISVGLAALQVNISALPLPLPLPGEPNENRV